LHALVRRGRRLERQAREVWLKRQKRLGQRKAISMTPSEDELFEQRHARDRIEGAEAAVPATQEVKSEVSGDC
jgi:hypothetical protein